MQSARNARDWHKPVYVCMYECVCVCVFQADTVVFDDELSPGQLRNLEKAFSGGPGGRQVRGEEGGGGEGERGGGGGVTGGVRGLQGVHTCSTACKRTPLGLMWGEGCDFVLVDVIMEGPPCLHLTTMAVLGFAELARATHSACRACMAQHVLLKSVFYNLCQ